MSKGNGIHAPAAGFIPSNSSEGPPTESIQIDKTDNREQHEDPPVNSPDPLARFRLSQDFAELSPVKKKPSRPTIGRPKYSDFFRTMPGDNAWFDTKLLEYPDREYWLVEPEIQATLESEPLLKPKRLYLCVTTDRRFSLWPVRIAPEERQDSWNSSAHQIARDHATEHWVRIISDQSSKRYRAMIAENSAEMPLPDWARAEIEDILIQAFEGRIIDDSNHPVLRGLRGAI